MHELPIRQDSRGYTQFVLKLPYQLRVRLHAASQQTGASQQALVRGAIATYLESLRIAPERPVLMEPEVVNQATDDQPVQITSEVIDQVDQTTENPPTQRAPVGEPEVVDAVGQTTEDQPIQVTSEVVNQIPQQPKRRSSAVGRGKRSR
jgi:hypothetical protein